jgi:predicted CXXCH cytochrome family protein
VRDNAVREQIARKVCAARALRTRRRLLPVALAAALLARSASAADDAQPSPRGKLISAAGGAVPLPPPPTARKAVPLPPPPAAGRPSPSDNPFQPANAAPVAVDVASCAGCHAALLRRQYVHNALNKTTCATCHKPTARVGKCKSASASAWALTKPQGELCAACHDAKAIASPFKVKHDFKGRCVECHDAHASDRPKLMRASGKKLCLSCHDQRTGAREVTKRIDLTRKVVHAALEKNECQDCHEAGHGGAQPDLLKKSQPELCYGCHKRKDVSKVVHTAVRQGECLECHDAHSSNLSGLLRRPREQLCTSCHETEPLLTRSVKHAPVAEGRCLECHEAHGSDRPNLVLGTSKVLCLKCHDSKAESGGVSDAMRVDLTRKVLHKAVRDGECTDCHDAGHSGDNPRLLKKAPPDLCYNCHNRKDGQRFTHSAVRLGDCSVCHLPHSSDQPKLVAKATTREMCFTCHHDDLTGRPFLHKPAAEGKCAECHGPHGAPNRWVLVKGDGKQACYACHRPVDTGKVKHAALERYGCSGCHDPHGAGNRFLLAMKTNDLCISCHPRQPDGTHVSGARTSRGGHIVSGPIDPRRPDREFTCASCHNPHGSDSPRLFYMGASGMESCDGCHGDKTGKNPMAKNVIDRIYKARPQSQGSAGGGGSDQGASGPGATLPPAPKN